MNFNFTFDTKQNKSNENETKTESASTLTNLGKPSFNFAGIDTKSDSSSKPAGLSFPTFSFGGNDTKTDSSSKPTPSIASTFSFGGNDTKSDSSSKPAGLSFPTFSIGGNDTKSDSSSKPAAFSFPTFSFGGNETKGDSSSTPTISNFQFSFIGQKLTFNFGTGKEFQAEKKEFAPGVIKPFSFGGFAAPAKAEENEPAEEPEEAQNAFDETTETGEENEECCLDTPCALYQLVTEEEKKENQSETEKKEKSGDNKPRWAERGTGDLHFNHSQEQKFYRIIFRRKPLRNVILNQRISKDMKPKRLNQKSICFIGTLLQTETNQKESNDPPAITPLFLRFKDAPTADRFLELYEEATKQ